MALFLRFLFFCLLFVLCLGVCVVLVVVLACVSLGVPCAGALRGVVCVVCVVCGVWFAFVLFGSCSASLFELVLVFSPSLLCPPWPSPALAATRQLC